MIYRFDSDHDRAARVLRQRNEREWGLAIRYRTNLWRRIWRFIFGE